jgi:3D (Asp-Asp-Asp) domain-containing protein
MSIIAGVAFGYSLSGGAEFARAAQNPTAAKSSDEKSIEIPGTFKDLPAARDAVTSKRAATTKPAPQRNSRVDVAQLTVDESKGITPRSLARTGSRRVQPVNPIPAPEEIDATSDLDFEDFNATAYCLQGRTASGEQVKPGIIAADPRVLPIGTVVHIRAGRYTGTYTVMDTGGRIKGHHVDVYVPTYKEAKAFGRRSVKLKVIAASTRKNKGAGRGPILTESK